MNYVRENVTAIKNFAEYLMPGELDSVDELKPGEGGIIRNGMSRIAACRDRDGKLHLRSAVCTHLGCHVHWNSTEQCWDCPCHGSQFRAGRRGAQRPGHHAAGACSRAGEGQNWSLNSPVVRVSNVRV